MIHLFTGLPGNGKTLYALNVVKAIAEKSKRKVYYSGIKDLTLPWELFGAEVDPEKPHETDCSKWHELPKGAIIVIDEAQRLFRPRGTGSQVPDYVAALETHRHRGHDLYIITQHPMLVDANVRRLVGSHFHVVRNLGLAYATVNEWRSCTDIQKSSLDSSVKHEFRYPKDAYTWYKSAEIHTHKARVPARVFFMLGAPVLIVGLLWFGWTRVSHLMDGNAVKSAKSVAAGKIGAAANAPPPTKAGGPGLTSHLSRADYIAQYVPRVAALPHTAPVYDEVTKVVRAPYPAGCVVSEKKGCQCYDQDGGRLTVELMLCAEIADRGYFVAWLAQKFPPPVVAPSPPGGTADTLSKPAPGPVPAVPPGQLASLGAGAGATAAGGAPAPGVSRWENRPSFRGQGAAVDLPELRAGMYATRRDAEESSPVPAQQR